MTDQLYFYTGKYRPFDLNDHRHEQEVAHPFDLNDHCHERRQQNLHPGE